VLAFDGEFAQDHADQISQREDFLGPGVLGLNIDKIKSHGSLAGVEEYYVLAHDSSAPRRAIDRAPVEANRG
jgi:hypothetical protein